MLPVVWLETALLDLTAITEYIAERNPAAATKLNYRLQEDAELLGELPAIFRRGPVPGTRQFVSHPNYILIYRVTTVAVEILNVVHSRQQYP
ncbi:MAG: type II toxin-antitoxin system mRNA interferase toxin, RelE/StbE family [Burkholderiales bacterium PBB3]|nr:MAG: type II toxin-antitoxin system mRNA interferase toxin, RelE/StbE family [Burkholderiales bacterium PBB3]